jgi:hypothetical protein
MNYELAERLRDTGFPQSGDGRRIGAPTAFLWRARDLVYVPTLEELIAACGDEFGEMARRPDGSFEAVARGSSRRYQDKQAKPRPKLSPAYGSRLTAFVDRDASFPVYASR